MALPLSLLVFAGIAGVLAWKSPLWHRTMPRDIHPLTSLGWLALALAGLTLMLVLAQAGRSWRSAWPLWQQRALSLSLIIIATQGVTAAYYAAGAWMVAAFPPRGEALSEDYFAWSLCVFLTIVGLATWLGLVVEDATGTARARLPLFAIGVGASWAGWRAPPWYRGATNDVVQMLFGLTASRVVTMVLGVGTATYAIFGSMEHFHW
jgi:hypothetical protein